MSTRSPDHIIAAKGLETRRIGLKAVSTRTRVGFKEGHGKEKSEKSYRYRYRYFPPVRPQLRGRDSRHCGDAAFLIRRLSLIPGVVASRVGVSRAR